MSIPANELSVEDDQQIDNADNRRQLKHFFLKPKYQLKYVNWFMSGAFVLLVSTVGFIHFKLGQIDHILNASADAPITNQIPVYHAFSDITMIALGGFVAFVLFTCALALLINHRVAGPMIAIVDHLEALRQGNYDYTRELRHRDELQPIHDAVKDLARTLQDRQPHEQEQEQEQRADEHMPQHSAQDQAP